MSELPSILNEARKGVKPNIVLTGFMGAGKTTVAALLAEELGYEVLDTDEIITKRSGLSIPEAFEKYGEEYFRICEEKVIIDMQHRKCAVISLGGGAVVKEGNIKNIKECGVVVYLKVSAETSYNRVKNSADRPLISNDISLNRIKALMDEREEKYNRAADITVVADDKAPTDISAEIIKKITIFNCSAF